MALNSSSKHGIVIASVSAISCLMFSVSQILELKRMREPEANVRYYPREKLMEDAITLAVALLATLLSILMCVGIVQKRCMLLAAWLAAAIPIACYIGGENLYQATKGSHFDHYVISAFLISLGIGFIYPICQLFLEMRREIAAKPKYIEQK